MNTPNTEPIIIATVCVEDIAADDTRLAGWWTSEDGQRQMDMSGAPLHEAVSDMLDGCSADEQRAGILAGTLDVIAAS